MRSWNVSVVVLNCKVFWGSTEFELSFYLFLPMILMLSFGAVKAFAVAVRRFAQRRFVFYQRALPI
jgi:hypothetical protein